MTSSRALRVSAALASRLVARNTVQLVAPSFISVFGYPADLAATPSFAVLTLSFAPEPGILLMLSCGVASLLLLGRRATHR